MDIIQVGPDELERYGRIPIAFRVESVLRVVPVDGGLGGLRLVEEAVDEPYTKDYDAFEEESVELWPSRFDVSNWAFFMALDGDRPVGGAAVAFRSPGLNMLEGRTDMAVLWDIRVHPERRCEGIGTALFRHVADWARDRGCRQLKIETQNINVRACRFYAAMGCTLASIDRHAYAAHPDIGHESCLLWHLSL